MNRSEWLLLVRGSLSRHRVLAGALAVGFVFLLTGLWYAFRPELLVLDRTVSEAFPNRADAAMGLGVTEPKPLLVGQFKGHAHDTDGRAAIFEVNGKRVLRLTNFRTSNGPDVHVYLVAANDVRDDATVGRVGFVDLGPMKGNVGDQNYDVSGDADPAKYRAVTIWCVRFNVNFGTARLRSSP